MIDGPARPQVGEEVAHCFLLGRRRARSSVPRLLCCCRRALVSGRGDSSVRSQQSIALPARVQWYAVDAFCSQFARRLKKWSRLAVCKTLAIKQAVAASLYTHKLPCELYHTAPSPLVLESTARLRVPVREMRLLSGRLNELFRHARLQLPQNVSTLTL